MAFPRVISAASCRPSAPASTRARIVGNVTEIRCPNCGERDELRGERQRAAIWITCDRCDTAWLRDPDLCPSCGKRSVSDRREPLIQKARGTQQSIIGYRIVKECWACGWRSESEEATGYS